jgi:hypothetical protein
MIPSGKTPRAGYGSTFRELDQRRPEFQDLYIRKGLALRPVSAAMKVSFQTLIRWMDSRNIPRRGQKQAARIRSKRSGKTNRVIFLRLFRKMTMDEIREALGYTSTGTVHGILAYHGLDGPLDAIPREKILYWQKQLEGTSYGCGHEEAGSPAADGPTGGAEPPEAEG